MKNTYLIWGIGAIVVILFLLGLLIFFQSIHSSFMIIFFLELLALALLLLMLRAYSFSRQRGQGWHMQHDLLALVASKLSIGQGGRSIGSMLNTITIAVVTIMLAWLILLWGGTAVFGSHPSPTPTASPIVSPTKIPKHTPTPIVTITPKVPPKPSKTP